MPLKTVKLGTWLDDMTKDDVTLTRIAQDYMRREECLAPSMRHPDVDSAKKYAQTIAQTLAAKITQTPSDCIMVPYVHLEEGDEPNELVLTCALELYKKCDLNAEAAEKDGWCPLGYSYILSSWDEIANFDVLVDDTLCKRHKVEMAADAIWETTFLGEDEESASKRRDEMEEELSESIEEAEAGNTVSFDPRAELEKLVDPYELEHWDACATELRPVYSLMWNTHKEHLRDLVKTLCETSE